MLALNQMGMEYHLSRKEKQKVRLAVERRCQLGNEKYQKAKTKEIDHNTEAHSDLWLLLVCCDGEDKGAVDLPRTHRGNTSALKVKGIGPAPIE